jgi:hypothetical protein
LELKPVLYFLWKGRPTFLRYGLDLDRTEAPQFDYIGHGVRAGLCACWVLLNQTQPWKADEARLFCDDLSDKRSRR